MDIWLIAVISIVSIIIFTSIVSLFIIQFKKSASPTPKDLFCKENPCNKGESCIQGVCVCDNVLCENLGDHKCDNGRCISTCKKGFTYDPTKGNCVCDIIKTCESGKCNPDGNCRCPNTCPTGKYCHNKITKGKCENCITSDCNCTGSQTICGNSTKYYCDKENHYCDPKQTGGECIPCSETLCEDLPYNTCKLCSCGGDDGCQVQNGLPCACPTDKVYQGFAPCDSDILQPTSSGRIVFDCGTQYGSKNQLICGKDCNLCNEKCISLEEAGLPNPFNSKIGVCKYTN